MNLFFLYLKEKRRGFFLFLGFAAVFAVSFLLFRVPLPVVLYPTVLCAIIGILCMISDFLRFRRLHISLEDAAKRPSFLLGDLNPGDSVIGNDYCEVIGAVCEENRQAKADASKKYDDMINYYTLWAHQIKTPISSMRIALQNEDSSVSRKLRTDLGRIERYVEMVLTYIRIDGDSNDFCFGEYCVDDIVRPVVRKFAGDFIGKRLTLNYSGISEKVLTDEKWLGFVLEQLISNAVKYTEAGSISIFMTEDKKLCIKDTGIGIRPEDLPRIFESGYTGFNGRWDKKASGIGLNLCRRICDMLGHELSVKSREGAGSEFFIDLGRRKTVYE
ncbi:MAG: sensor histidine kinase [Lachnospiraceae bacterium]|jgi:two-component system sensor histidine kinase BraS/BceS